MLRRYTTEDIPEMLDIIKEFLKESTTFKDISYDRQKVENMLYSNVNNNRFFCNLLVDDTGKEIFGGLCAQLFEYTFSREMFANDLIFFILPTQRGLRPVTELVNSYVTWAKARNVNEIRLASSTGNEANKFGRLCEFLGFDYLGPIYTMRIK